MPFGKRCKTFKCDEQMRDIFNYFNDFLLYFLLIL